MMERNQLIADILPFPEFHADDRDAHCFVFIECNNGGGRVGWNSSKSLALIRQYEPGYASDGEGEEDAKSRRRRLRLARLIGVTRVQLNFAQMTL